jgi:hypothetical protein
METYDVLISIAYKGKDSRCVLAAEDLPDAPLPKPGQRNEIYTYRIYNVPERYKSWQVGDRLIQKFLQLEGRPGVAFETAYNIPWETLRDGSIVSAQESFTFDEAMKFIGCAKTTLQDLLSKGKIAVTRIPQVTSGPRPVTINKTDLEYFLAHKRSRGGQPKKRQLPD